MSAVAGPGGTPGGAGGRQASAGQGATARTPSAPIVDYDVTAATQTYIKSAVGGVQRVVALESSDAKEIGLIRSSLQRLANDFSTHDFAAPGHGQPIDLPGLAALVAAPPGDLHAEFFEIRGGAEIRYSSQKPELVRALHEWFDAVQAQVPAADRRTVAP